MSPLTETHHKPNPLVAVTVVNAPDTIPHSPAPPAGIPLKESRLARVNRSTSEFGVRERNGGLLQQCIAFCAGRHIADCTNDVALNLGTRAGNHLQGRAPNHTRKCVECDRREKMSRGHFTKSGF